MDAGMLGRGGQGGEDTLRGLVGLALFSPNTFILASGAVCLLLCE